MRLSILWYQASPAEISFDAARKEYENRSRRESEKGIIDPTKVGVSY